MQINLLSHLCIDLFISPESGAPITLVAPSSEGINNMLVYCRDLELKCHAVITVFKPRGS